MAASGNGPRETRSMGALSTELLILVLNQLREIDPSSLGTVRLVSKRLDTIVIPIKYHTIRLTQHIIAPQAETNFPAGIANICAYTRHVRVDSDHNAEHVRRLLDKIERLSSVSWRYVQNVLRNGIFSVPSDIIPPRHIRSRDVRLYIENLPLQDFPCQQQNPYLRAIPTNILTSLKMTTPTPPLTARVRCLKGLLLHSSRLETFRYEDRGQGTQFSFNENERFPPFQELSLRSYDWNHSPAVVQQHWDFSKLRRLEMIDVPLNPFLSSVCFADLEHLEALCLDDFSMHLPDTRRDATIRQYDLIKQIRALVDLKITCHTQLFPADAILRHAGTLRCLRFRDYVGFTDEEHRCPTMKIEDLDMMSQELVNLGTLELDMDEKHVETNPFLLTLCRFKHLHTLVLHTQTVVDPLKDVNASRDLDRERATQMISLLVREKQGALWRTITINIGGWKPIMVRRLSAHWRRLNRRGVHAERCFVMESSEDAAVVVREALPTRVS